MPQSLISAFVSCRLGVLVIPVAVLVSSDRVKFFVIFIVLFFCEIAISRQHSAFSLLLFGVCGLLFVMRDFNRKERYEGAKGAKLLVA